MGAESSQISDLNFCLAELLPLLKKVHSLHHSTLRTNSHDIQCRAIMEVEESLAFRVLALLEARC